MLQAKQKKGGKREKMEVMRKHMNRAISETMEKDPKVVYIGEDVEHGGELGILVPYLRHF